MADAQALLELVRSVAEKSVGRITLDSNLEADVGLDSLSRVELGMRIEKSFNVRLRDDGMMGAETPRDLLAMIERGGGVVERTPTAAAAPQEDVGSPDEAATLVEALEWHAERHPDRKHIGLMNDDGPPETITYGALLEAGRRVAGGLKDVEPGQPIGLMLQTCRDYFEAFFGILMAGGVPVPLYPPARRSKLEEHMRRQAAILANARAPLLIASEETRPAGRLLKGLLPGMRGVATVAELSSVPRERPVLMADQPALIQYTSGSTGNPKGVVLSHANLLSNIRAMKRALKVDGADVFVSWLPLYHDMGLIGAWLGSLYIGSRAALMSPMSFLARPPRWLRAIHAERGTISAAPNFAYDLCATKVDPSELQGLDLSSWRFALNGAECVHAASIDRFCARFGPMGFRREAMTPVYGLAESSLGVTFPPPGRGPRVDRIRRDEFERERKAVPSETGELTFVSCGSPLSGHAVRILDEAGRDVEERREGRLQFQGPSSTSGYYRNEEATRALVHGEWRDSGDYAYFAAGEVYLTGRAKDLIIKAGRNIHPQPLEEAVGAIPGVRRGCVAVFGSADARRGTERLIVAAETALTDPAEREVLAARIREAAAEQLDDPVDKVVLVPLRSVPKTPSGKIQRDLCRRLYESGELGKVARAQVARLMLAGVGPTLRRWGARVGGVAYTLWGWSEFVGVGLPAWALIRVTPSQAARRAQARATMRLMLRLAGIPLEVKGTPASPCVIVANHASYLDGPVLTAALPTTFTFVIKREMLAVPLAGTLLARLGSIFVERFDPEKGVADAAAVTEAVRRGESMVVFPEGTFRREAGVLPFKMGAFLTAAQAGIPVVPVAIRGTRAILRGDERGLRRGPIAVEVGEPIRPAGSDWSAATALRDAARRWIVEHGGEFEVAARPDSGLI